MKAITLESPGQLRLVSIAEPHNPEPGEALIRIRQVGVCGTDFHAFRGEQPFFNYPRILGHELGVEVIAVNPQEHNLAIGWRCAVEPYFSCGHCLPCRHGKPNCCVNLKVFGVHIDGGLREFAIVPTTQLHPSQTLTFEQLAMVEPLSIGAHAVARAQLVSGEHVLVVGAGPIGLAVTQFAILAGATVMVMDLSEQRLAFCHKLWPEIICCNGRNDALLALQDVVSDDLPVAVFDATGNPHSMQSAFNFTAHGGRLIFVGLFQGNVTFNDPDFHSRELTLMSSRNATWSDFRQIIDNLETNKIDLSAWITHRSSYETMIDEFPHWFDHDNGLIKAMVAL